MTKITELTEMTKMTKVDGNQQQFNDCDTLAVKNLEF